MTRPFQALFRQARRHPGALLQLALLGPAAYFLGRHLWARQQFRAARSALAAGELEQAREHLRRCLKVRPADAPSLLLAAQTARRLGACREAEEHLAACERHKPDDPEVALERSLLRAQQGDLEGVEEALVARAKADGPEAALVLEALGKGYLERFRWPDALRCLDELLKRSPEGARALLLRGRAWEGLSRAEHNRLDGRARDDYARAVELSPRLVEARLALADILYRLGNAWEAAAHFEHALRQRPGDPEALLGLARCRHDLNELDEARRLLDELLAAHPEHVAGLVERARLAFRRGRAQEAESDLLRAVPLARPCDSEPHRLLALYLEAWGRKEESARHQAEAERVESENLRVEKLILRARGSPADAALCHEIGAGLRRLGREEDAVSWFFSALDRDASCRPAHAALAEHFEKAGQARRAARHRRAAEAAP